MIELTAHIKYGEQEKNLDLDGKPNEILMDQIKFDIYKQKRRH